MEKQSYPLARCILLVIPSFRRTWWKCFIFNCFRVGGVLGMKSSSELGDGDRVRNKGDRGGEEGADVAEADPRPFLLVGAGESE